MTTEQPDTATPDESTESRAAEITDATADAEDTTSATEAGDTADAEPGTPAAQRSRGTIVAAGVLAVLLLASAGLAAWLYFHSYRPDQQTGQAASNAVLDSAKAGTVAALSYSPDTLDKDLETAKSHLTGDFLSYYDQFTDQVVRPAVKTKHVSTTAEVIRAAVSDLQSDRAKVLVFVNQTTTSADRQEPSMTSSSVVVTLTKTDGKWLISAFDPV